MHISRVELENIKSYTTADFAFSRGTTAITGENGAGKTTIIEAIAWTLFDLLDYKKEDFLKRGSAKGWARVTFQSGLDEREYIVYRDTATGYNVTDARLQTIIANKREEVHRFLWQHLGLEPGSDLRSLFRQAIGVPQGAFTAIFLEGATDRKSAFDRLLKVEEYRQAAEKLLDTAKYVNNSLAAAREAIARAEGEIARENLVATEHKKYSDLTASGAAELDTLSSNLDTLRHQVNDLDTRQKAAAESRAEAERLAGEVEKSEVVLRNAREALTRSEKAAATLDVAREDADRHTAALAELSLLEAQRSERDKTLAALNEAEAGRIKTEADRSRLESERESILAARAEVAGLRPHLAEQTRLEASMAKLRDELAEMRAAQSSLADTEQKLDELRTRFRDTRDNLRVAEERSALAGELTELEARHGELLNGLAELKASLDRDQKFQAEIKGGLCPILSSRCLNLAEGETLESFVSTQFDRLHQQISLAETERSSVEIKLALAREARIASAEVGSLRKRMTELEKDGVELRAQKDLLEKKSSRLGATEAELASQTEALSRLGDPRGRTALLERQLVRLPEVDRQIADLHSALKEIDIRHRHLSAGLARFAGLDERLAVSIRIREDTQTAYREFLVNEPDAKLLTERRTSLGEAERQLELHSVGARRSAEAAESAAAEYDAKRHAGAVEEMRLVEKNFHGAEARLAADRRRLGELTAELNRITSVRSTMQADRAEKQRLETLGETTDFIRVTLKEAAPRIARNYVHHVSIEANQIFREITGSAEHTLRWADDYSIVVEETGFDRPFQSLSGGEQMAAALSVRLGLLRQLSDIRISTLR